MRIMVIVKATEESESGTLPGKEILAEKGQFNEENLTPELRSQGARQREHLGAKN